MGTKLKLTADEKWRKKLNGYFIAFCRKVFRWSPAYREVLAKAFVKKDPNGEWFKCKACSSVVLRRDKQVDHIAPVVGRSGWNGSWDNYREHMFVESSALDVLCRSCHKIKTQKENTLRRKAKKENQK